MRVLVACEFSGVVREAFRALGHDAWSCDLLPAEDGSPYHFVGDARTLFWMHWDLLIAHPPCTFLTQAGVRWLYLGGRKENGMDFKRWNDMNEAAAFYNDMMNAPVDRICAENPRMHPYAIEICGEPTQFIQPWRHGHGEVKGTGLRLKNLPPLRPTNIVDGRTARVHRMNPGPNRWKERSRTLPGIANAFAAQWGCL